MIDEELIRLIREVVKSELVTSRLKVAELSGSGGNTVISSRGDITLAPGIGRHAYYQKGTGKIEIGSGSGSGGGAVSSVFGRTGAVTAVCTDYSSCYLSLAGGTLTGDLSLGGHDIENVNAIDSPDGVILALRYGSTSPAVKLGITSTGITSYGELAMASNKITGLAAGTTAGDALRYEQLVGVYLPLTGGTLTGDLDLNLAAPDINLKISNVTQSNWSSNGTEVMLSVWVGDFYLRNKIIGKTLNFGTNNIDRLTIADAGITATVPLAMGSQKITGLAAGTVAGDALRYEQLVGLYLSLAGGTLTGDLNINKTAPMIFFKNAAGTTQYGGVGSLGGHMYIDVDSSAENIFLRVATTIRLQISNTGVYLGSDLILGSNKLRGTAGGGSDVILGDDLSGLKAASTYADIKSIGTITPGSTGTKDLGSSSLFWNELFAQIHYVEATTLKIDKNGSNMRFTIPSYGVYEFVVSA